MSPHLLEVRQAAEADLRRIAGIHGQAFPGFLMSLLGPAFLRHYYRSVLEFSGGICLVAVGPSGAIVGFVSGFVDPGGFYSTFWSRRTRAVATSLFHVAFRPAIWRKVLANARRVRDHGRSKRSAWDAELSSIAVEPGSGGMGVGRALLDAFMAESRRKGASSVCLTTDASDNEHVNDFYSRYGFAIERTFERGSGRLMHEYRFELTEWRG